MWMIEFFEKDNGRCPTRDFLDKLSPAVDLPHIMERFGQLEEHGYKLDRPLAAHLGDGIDVTQADQRLADEYRTIYYARHGKKR